MQGTLLKRKWIYMSLIFPILNLIWIPNEVKLTGHEETRVWEFNCPFILITMLEDTWIWLGLPGQILLVIQIDSWPHKVMSLSLTQQNLCNHQKARLWAVGKGKMLARVLFCLRSLMGTRLRLLKPVIEKLMIMLHLSSIFGAIKSNEWTRKIRRTFNKEIPKWNSKTITSHCACLCPVAQLCLTLCCPKDCSLPGFSAHGIFQGRILE